jgi:hypothetical protein
MAAKVGSLSRSGSALLLVTVPASRIHGRSRVSLSVGKECLGCVVVGAGRGAAGRKVKMVVDDGRGE